MLALLGTCTCCSDGTSVQVNKQTAEEASSIEALIDEDIFRIQLRRPPKSAGFFSRALSNSKRSLNSIYEQLSQLQIRRANSLGSGSAQRGGIISGTPVQINEQLAEQKSLTEALINEGISLIPRRRQPKVLEKNVFCLSYISTGTIASTLPHAYEQHI